MSVFTGEPQLLEFSLEDLREAWPGLDPEEKLRKIRVLGRARVEELFLGLDVKQQAEFLLLIPEQERRAWIRQMEPDDLADVLQELDLHDRASLLSNLDELSRKEVVALLAYEEDVAGGLMSPRFARVRPDMRIDEAILYLRRQAEGQVETIYYAYVLDREQKLMGIVSFRELFVAKSDQKVSDIMHHDIVTVQEDTDQETLSQLFAKYDLMAIPVLDREGRIKGIVTVDDIVHVVKEEATEDIHRLGGTEALDEPYLHTSFFSLLRKRAGWLTILFVGEMFTAQAMGHYEHEIARAVVLSLFIPMIISSGGNSGSQASTLVTRAMALGEIKLRDWWRVMGREILMGLSLGAILGTIGLLRIIWWPARETLYGPHYKLIALSVSFSLVGIVLWGSLAGSMLPFAFKRLGLDPATASAPFVATLVDVTGLIIYFTVAQFVLAGTVL